MRRWLGLAPLIASCRFLAPAQAPVSAAQPYEPPSAVRTPAPAANRCGLRCDPGFRCDEETATCRPVNAPADARDAGPAWMP
ncbi:MAG: hypothetical protein JNJ54_06845 [Myxococcaceae bacterium]|nr:hypothetical protein [Myxococcaceae bacterium]